MNKKNIDQALGLLADALKSDDPEFPINSPSEFVKRIPKRSLSGDHIIGGKILDFKSAGITDTATSQQVLVTDKAVEIKTLKVEYVKDNLTVEGTVTANIIKVDVLEVKELKADIKFEKEENVAFGGKDVYGKGLIWKDAGYVKQFVFNGEPDRFFSSETIDLQKGKHFSVNNIKVLSDIELGPTVTKSNLREIGKLRGLLVDGPVVINNYLYYNASSDRLGLGTEEPNAAFAVAEDGIEVMVGTKDSVKGIVGTFASNDFDIVTDNTSRISVSAAGNVQLGNTKQPPVQVSIHGKLAIKVSMPDPEVDLHVAGAVKFNNKLQKYGDTYPIAGAYNVGDIVWNSQPTVRTFVGWVCVQAGEPGIWEPFGKIGN
jgi:hypothetical protein